MMRATFLRCFFVGLLSFSSTADCATTIAAMFFCKNEVSPVPIGTGGTQMLVGGVIMLTGTYILNGTSYVCNRQGLYRFIIMDTNTPQKFLFYNRIVFDRNNVDLYAVMSAISWNQVHGGQDEICPTDSLVSNPNYYLQLISNRGISHKWRLACGYIARLAKWLLPLCNNTIQTRVLNAVQDPSKYPANGYDEGHYVVETLDPVSQKWLMWDIDNGRYFVDAAGNHMSAQGFADSLAKCVYPKYIRLDAASKITADTLSAGSVATGKFYWDYGGAYDCNLLTEQQIFAWYHRIFSGNITVR